MKDDVEYFELHLALKTHPMLLILFGSNNLIIVVTYE